MFKLTFWLFECVTKGQLILKAGFIWTNEILIKKCSDLTLLEQIVLVISTFLKIRDWRPNYFSITRTIFLTVGQNNFGSKIPFRTREIFFHVQQSIKISPRFYIQVVSKADIVINNWVLVVPETFCLYVVESKKLRKTLLICIQYNVQGIS